MRYFYLLIILLSASCTNCALYELQAGDLLFQTNEKGLGSAIQEVTQSADKYSFTHVAMIVIDAEGSMQAVEAIGSGVCLTPIDSFLKRATTVVARVKKEYRSLLPAAIDFAIQQIGIPYDMEFIYNNGKYYCSELLYDAFLYANNGQPFFSLEPMTFKSTQTGDFSVDWVRHFSKLGVPIPEGAPGCNPGNLSRSEKINILNVVNAKNFSAQGIQ